MIPPLQPTIYDVACPFGALSACIVLAAVILILGNRDVRWPR